jgi:hypothetical protein
VYGIFNSRFWSSVSQKRLELKSLKGQTKAEELWTPCPELLSLRLPLLKGSLLQVVLQEKLDQNGGTEGAPRGDGPSLKILIRAAVPSSKLFFFIIFLIYSCTYSIEVRG